MKKLFFSVFILIICFSLCACGAAGKVSPPAPDAVETEPDSYLGNSDSVPVPEAEEKPYYRLSEDGRQLTVSLYSNPSTGYSWQWGADKKDCIYLLFDDFISDENGLNTGVGGMYEAKFCPTMVNFGEVQLVLSYERTWEAEPISTHVLKLSIDQNGTITVLSAT